MFVGTDERRRDEQGGKREEGIGWGQLRRCGEWNGGRSSSLQRHSLLASILVLVVLGASVHQYNNSSTVPS